MNASENSEKKRLELVYKYFSHHMRTNTAVIVAMLEAINEGLSDESMTEMIMESGYLLDIFDRGMSVCFNHIFDKSESSDTEQVDLHMLIKLFVDNGVTKDINGNVTIDLPESTMISCEPYAFKSLIQIFLHEAALVSKEKFSVVFDKNTLTISPDTKFYENPPVFSIMKEILKKNKISLLIMIKFLYN